MLVGILEGRVAAHGTLASAWLSEHKLKLVLLLT